jgi:hypothetical protein
VNSPARPRRRAVIILLLIALAILAAMAAVRLTSRQAPPRAAEPSLPTAPTAPEPGLPVPPTPAKPHLPTTPVLVSGPSPYADCTLGGDGEGKRYVGAEVETMLTVNPVAYAAGKVELIGTWMADRWSTGGSAGLVTAVSSDAGNSWAPQPIAFSGCAQDPLLPYNRATDPWVSFGPDGVAYASGGLVHRPERFYGIGTAVSKDGGRT